MSSRRLQHVFSATISRLPRRLQDVWMMSWKHLANKSRKRLQDVFKTSCEISSRRISKTSWRRLGRRKIVTLKTSWRRLQDMSWRRLEDVLDINKMFTRISVLIHGLLRNLNQYLTNLYLTNLYFTNLRRIQNALIRTQ